ncbi:LysM peptidoglycan-binding domain-containing protein [Oceanisphaera psychrotolerans]|uniref:LysM peptidoglycan-binding domain-containing protein n=1 Tax=Oceanisphaera psychrotolerans TaxID=1414654 RepID=UPI001FE1D6C7|nr:LysM domain-containing protein [Oceanisphaera psychrotolerans]
MQRRGGFFWLGGVNLLLITLLTACSASRPAPVVGVHASGHFQADGRRYVVVKGDTLYSIAWQAGTDVPTLRGTMVFNRLTPFIPARPCDWTFPAPPGRNTGYVVATPSVSSRATPVIRWPIWRP